MNLVGRYLVDVLAARSGMLNVSRATPAVSPAAPPRVSRTAQVAERDIACQCCQQQVSKQHNAMLLCDGCDRGYHQRCLAQPLVKVPKGNRLCPGCEVQVANGAEARTVTLGAAPADGQACVVCCDPRDGSRMLLCDRCDCGFHWYCVGENRCQAPRGTWLCPGCRPGGTSPARCGARAHGACATAGAQ